MFFDWKDLNLLTINEPPRLRTFKYEATRLKPSSKAKIKAIDLEGTKKEEG